MSAQLPRETMLAMSDEAEEATVLATKRPLSPPYEVPVAQGSVGRFKTLPPASAKIDREHLLDRLQHLRGILPVFAQELANARRQAAALRVENRGLLEEVRRLRARDRQRFSGQH